MVLTWTGKRWADRVQLQLSRFAPIVQQLLDGVPPPPVCYRSTIIQSGLLVPENNYSFTQSRESLSLILWHAGCPGKGSLPEILTWDSQNIFTLLAASYSWPQGNNATRCFFKIWRRLWSHFSEDAIDTPFSSRLSCQTSEWVPEVLVVVYQLQSF